MGASITFAASDFRMNVSRIAIPDKEDSTAFLPHVMDVLCLRTQPEVIGSDAGGIVPIGAIVKNAFPFRNRTEVQFISESMSEYGSAFSLQEGTVSEWQPTAVPQPTGACVVKLYDVSPKAYFGGCGLPVHRTELYLNSVDA